jgi:D-sedoheptulose 7-phosphate isomerase
MLDDFFKVHEILSSGRLQIEESLALLDECFARGGKLLVCGNGGSAADAEHIVGELMKGFLRKRTVASEQAACLTGVDGELGEYLGTRLQGTLPAIALTGHVALSTAVANDNGGDLPFAQQVWGYGQAGDVFWGISTSGNSRNVLLAAVAAKAKGLAVIGMTGAGGGKLAQLADVCITVPSDETFEVQEYHLAIYHFLCAALEARFFET